ncbi:exodeoxyribonuclease I [Candidatus Saccharibacteria bacterium]|nr:exodeoxyribonuclease I [Candidatus Saccharibacteria bacterium]
MEQTFFFYDLETSGLDARADRPMQFAGQRTDLQLNPIGDPVNVLIKLGEDTLPSPHAIMVTKITPQSTLQDGLTEAEFCKYVSTEIFTPGTIAIGYNSVRFDDEFMRHTFWRNYYDPYEWQWRDGRSRWDLLDVVRMTRALRPDGINWPVTAEVKATNRLELITQQNHIAHEHAHDALSDVEALISVTRLIKEKQPQLYAYLFKMREKRAVQQLINLENPQPFVYASGRYAAEHEKTTVAFPLSPARNGNVLVYDLRYNLDELLAEKQQQATDDPGAVASFYPVVKELKYNHCPAVAPVGVLEQGNAWRRIGLSATQVQDNLKSLLRRPEFAEQMRSQHEAAAEFPPAVDAESALYDGFLSDLDKKTCNAVRNADAQELSAFHPEFHDERLEQMFVRYKARNFESILTETERHAWDEYRLGRIKAKQSAYAKALQDLAAQGADSFILEELQLWYQSLLPY